MNESENNIEQSQKPQKVFALLADGEVFHKWYIEEDYLNSYMAALIYGLQSGPTIVDITDKNHEEISFGWTQDGDSFIPPTFEE
jgi:hypothetical protein